jgi:hypothetical protein
MSLKAWEERDRGLDETLPLRLQGGIEENNNKSFRISGVPAEAWTENLPSTSLELYSYINLLGTAYLSEPRVHKYICISTREKLFILLVLQSHI